MTTLCDHGYFLHDCALCVKRAGECDYGSCVEVGTVNVPTFNARGVVAERRLMCKGHALRDCDRPYCGDTVGYCENCPQAPSL